MISEKKQLFFLPIVLLIFAVVLSVGWIHTLIMVGATTLGATIGYNGQIGLWGASSKAKFTASKVLIVFWVALIVVLWLPDFLNITLWRQIVATLLILLIAAFDLIDSYLWYKKEQQELHHKESING
ncbi:hypothetical protein ACI2JA_20315 [Alkalihalobacillus sp. NPDC078783]